MDSTSALLLSSVKKLSLINKFVFGDDLKTAIRSIAGDDSVDAALLALSTNSVHPEGRIASAINHLEYAHISYIKMLDSIKDRYDYNAKCHDIGVFIRKDLLVCSLITLCHCGLKDYVAAQESLRWGLETVNRQEKMDRLGVTPRFMGIPAFDLHPKSFLSLPGEAIQFSKMIKDAIKGEDPGISSITYNEFYDSIGGLISR
jgi:hypothetical protein